MTCYYNDPKATAETLKNGWLYTGDMAMQDEDGFYFLVDRKKDVIVSGGENIYPVQIENFLSAYEKVQDVAVMDCLTAVLVRSRELYSSKRWYGMHRRRD